jgi:hypothetical protein
MPSFLFVAPFSIDSTFITRDLNLDMRFVLILNYKHVRTAGLTVRTGEWMGGGKRGAKPYDGEKAWSSINHSRLSDLL